MQSNIAAPAASHRHAACCMSFVRTELQNLDSFSTAAVLVSMICDRNCKAKVGVIRKV
jgi:hypothetical protein